MIAIRIHRRPDGDYVYCCGQAEGRTWTPLGCQHLSPREAARHADTLDDSAEGSPVASVPLVDAARGEPSAESSRDDSRPTGTGRP